MSSPEISSVSHNEYIELRESKGKGKEKETEVFHSTVQNDQAPSSSRNWTAAALPSYEFKDRMPNPIGHTLEDELIREYEKVMGVKPSVDDAKLYVKAYRKLAKSCNIKEKISFESLKKIRIKAVYVSTSIFAARSVAASAKHILTITGPLQAMASLNTVMTALMSSLVVLQSSVQLYSAIKNSRMHKSWLNKVSKTPTVVVPSEKAADKASKASSNASEDAFSNVVASEDVVSQNVSSKMDEKRLKELKKSFPELKKEELKDLLKNGNAKEVISALIESRKKNHEATVEEIRASHPSWNKDQIEKEAAKREMASTSLRSALSILEIKKHKSDRKFYKLQTVSAYTKLGINAVMSVATGVMAILELASVATFPPMVLLIPTLANLSKWGTFMGIGLFMQARSRPNLLKTMLKGVILQKSAQKVMIAVPRTAVRAYYHLDSVKKDKTENDKKLERVNLAIKYAEALHKQQNFKASDPVFLTLKGLLLKNGFSKKDISKINSAQDVTNILQTLRDRKETLEASKIKIAKRLESRKLEKFKWKQREASIEDKVYHASSKDFLREAMKGREAFDQAGNRVDLFDVIAESIVDGKPDNQTKEYLKEHMGVDLDALNARLRISEQVEIKRGNRLKRFFRSVSGIDDHIIKSDQEVMRLKREQKDLKRKLRDMTMSPNDRAVLEDNLQMAQSEYKVVMKKQVVRELEQFFGMREKQMLDFISTQKKQAKAKVL